MFRCAAPPAGSAGRNKGAEPDAGSAAAAAGIITVGSAGDRH